MAELRRATDPGDALLADFVALNDPDTRRTVERAGDYFVVEGILAIERLLQLPQWSVRTLALLPKVAERLAPLLDATDATVAVADAEVLRQVVGFDIHRGALASVARAPGPALADVLEGPGNGGTGAVRSRLVLVAEGVNDHENLGALYRNAAAFGCAAVALDPTCADPFYRRSVRVSLGNVLAVPTVRLGPFPGAVAELAAAGLATVALTPSGETPLADLPALAPPNLGWAVIVGAEGPGLPPATLAAADHRAAISMAADVDSLNVATAAAIALFQLSAQ